MLVNATYMWAQFTACPPTHPNAASQQQQPRVTLPAALLRIVAHRTQHPHRQRLHVPDALNQLLQSQVCGNVVLKSVETAEEAQLHLSSVRWLDCIRTREGLLARQPEEGLQQLYRSWLAISVGARQQPGIGLRLIARNEACLVLTVPETADPVSAATPPYLGELSIALDVEREGAVRAAAGDREWVPLPAGDGGEQHVDLA